MSAHSEGRVRPSSRAAGIRVRANMHPLGYWSVLTAEDGAVSVD